MFIESHSLQSYITKIMYTNMIGDGVNTNRGLIALVSRTQSYTQQATYGQKTHTHTHNKQEQ